MKKILLIGDVWGCDNLCLPNYHVTRLKMIKKSSLLGKIIRHFSIRFKLKKSFDYFTVNEAVSLSEQSDIVILFDSTRNFILANYMECIEQAVDSSKTRLILYFWNHISTLADLPHSYQWRYSCFDKLDSEKYDINYMGGFYNPLTNIDISKQERCDLFFAGTNKHRFHFIRRLEDKLAKAHVRTQFIYVSKKSLFNKKYSKKIPYSLLLSKSIAANAILDVTSQNQFGLTLRFYEAFFFQKKLVTNHIGIMQYKIYNPNRILVIDDNTSADEIKRFCADQHVTYDQSEIEQYSFIAWLDRIINQKRFNDTIR